MVVLGLGIAGAAALGWMAERYAKLVPADVDDPVPPMAAERRAGTGLPNGAEATNGPGAALTLPEETPQQREARLRRESADLLDRFIAVRQAMQQGAQALDPPHPDHLETLRGLRDRECRRQRLSPDQYRAVLGVYHKWRAEPQEVTSPFDVPFSQRASILQSLDLGRFEQQL